MPTKTLTETELLAELKKSHLTEEQKANLAPLVSQMDEKEKVQLADFIKESNQLDAETREYAKQMTALNDKYTKAANSLVKEETAKANKSAEQLKRKSEESEMKAIEDQISSFK